MGVLKVEVGLLDEGGLTLWPGGQFEMHVFKEDAAHAFEVLLAYVKERGEHIAGFRTFIDPE